MSEISSVVVSFGLHGEALDPAHVTSTLGLDPDHAHAKGDLRGGPRDTCPYTAGSWVLHSRLPEASPLDEHLRDLLDRLVPPVVHKLLREGLAASLRVGCFVEGDQEGTTVTADTLRRIRELGAELGITIYSGDDDEAET